MFYWKCQICKQTIREGHVERWMDKRIAHYHVQCLALQQDLEDTANKILEMNGAEKLVPKRKRSRSGKQ